MPSSRRASWVIVLPDFAARWAHERDRLPVLERLAAYGGGFIATESVPVLQPWQSDLVRLLGLGEAKDFPSAPFTQWGAIGALPSGAWLHADPVRLDVTSDGMRLRPIDDWPADQLATIEQLFRQHLGNDQARWITRAGRALVQLTAPLDACTVSPQAAAIQSVREALPHGPDASGIRRMMTELQMLMHDEFSAASSPNAVWLWGNGIAATHSVRSLPSLWTNDSYARGLYLAHGEAARCFDVPESLDAIMKRGDASLGVIVMRGSLTKQIDDCLEPALRALDKGRVDSVDVYLDGLNTCARRSLLKRWFMRPKSLLAAVNKENA